MDSNVTVWWQLCNVYSGKVWILHASFTVMQASCCFRVSCLWGNNTGTEVWIIAFFFVCSLTSFLIWEDNVGRWPRWTKRRSISISSDLCSSFLLFVISESCLAKMTVLRTPAGNWALSTDSCKHIQKYKGDLTECVGICCVLQDCNGFTYNIAVRDCYLKKCPPNFDLMENTKEMIILVSRDLV